MKFSCYKSDLTEALQFVIRAVAVKPMTPILAGIYLKAEGSMLEIQANNFSTGIVTRIPVNTEVSGETVVSGKRFQEFVRNMPDDTITISDEDSANNLAIESGGASVELLTMTASDFPKVKTPETDRSFKIRTTALRDLIRKTVFAVSKDNDRPIFTGCCFEIKGDKISLVATNAHRLALAAEQLNETYPDSAFVVPADTLRGLMLRIDPKDVENYVTINYSTRYLTFTFDNVFVNARLIEGQFPPYDRVIPASSTTNVKVDTAEFRAAVDFVSLMSKETEYNTVKFDFADGGVEISSNSPEIGGAVKNVEAEIDGDELEISFNVNYIVDVLKVIDAKQINIALNDKYSPAAFTEPDNENYIYIATPVRT
ncbi:MAG: DNA polymerase III subunit beta [Selenomonadaceae bacterium]|nr:DNA polymerase III subunit beta [Selenomonadaceae bacterium]MBQ6131244.1 DNA polymerase III subunit beta [Selenomonadaceae bacterium]